MHYIFFCTRSYMKMKRLCVLAVLLTSSLAGAANNSASKSEVWTLVLDGVSALKWNLALFLVIIMTKTLSLNLRFWKWGLAYWQITVITLTLILIPLSHMSAGPTDSWYSWYYRRRATKWYKSKTNTRCNSEGRNTL